MPDEKEKLKDYLKQIREAKKDMKVDRIIIDGQLTAFQITSGSGHVITLTKEEFLDLNKYITEYYAEVLQGLASY
jgi:hypothetical protein